MYISFIMMHYAPTHVFLSTGGLTYHTCIYGHGAVLSGKARKQVFHTSKGLVARISTEPIRPSGSGFLNQITVATVLTSIK